MTYSPAGTNPHAPPNPHPPVALGGLGIYTLVAAGIAWGGYAWFQKTRKGFAGVL